MRQQIVAKEGEATFDTLLATPLACCTILLERSDSFRRSGDSEGVKPGQRRTSPPFEKGEMCVSTESSFGRVQSLSHYRFFSACAVFGCAWFSLPDFSCETMLDVVIFSFGTRSCVSLTSLTHSIV